MSSSQPSDPRPVVLLDVDGVINDLGSLDGVRREWRTDLLMSNGFLLHIPEYMPALIQGIARVAEVHWCTTWRHHANREIAAHLGVGPFPVVDDGTSKRVVSWKAAAAYSLAESALNAGRRVVWIEDFYTDLPFHEMPIGVEYVDTAVHGDPVLTPAMALVALPDLGLPTYPESRF